MAGKRKINSEVVSESKKSKNEEWDIYFPFFNQGVHRKGYVFPLGVVFILSQAKFGPNNYRKDAYHFTFLSTLYFLPVHPVLRRSWLKRKIELPKRSWARIPLTCRSWKYCLLMLRDSMHVSKKIFVRTWKSWIPILSACKVSLSIAYSYRSI